MKEIWLKPSETKDLPDTKHPHHRFSIEVDGKEIGKAELVYFSKPIRFYYLDSLEVNPDYRSFRFGSQAIKAVNEFLDKKRVPGILLNIINEGALRDFYQNHGWKPTPLVDFLIYSKKDLPVDTIRKMFLRFFEWYN